MNCPSRMDNPDARAGWNQSPNAFVDATRQDFNGIANSRLLRRRLSDAPREEMASIHSSHPPPDMQPPSKAAAAATRILPQPDSDDEGQRGSHHVTGAALDDGQSGNAATGSGGRAGGWQTAKRILTTFAQFIGPGFMISVAYIDPGNYSTDVTAGASYRFKLLFVVLFSNIIAIFLQSLCIKLGTVTGSNLAQMCRAHLPKWLNIFLYLMAEAAIIATDIAEVIGTAIALNLLIPEIPLVAGCALSIADVLFILLFYHPNGSLKGLRAFEIFVVLLVLGVVICFIIQLSYIQGTSVGEVFRGFLPSSALVQSNGLYQSCGILGATVMPHSLYLGSGIVQPRLYDYDLKAGHVPALPAEHVKLRYRPSFSAIKSCLKYSITELVISLFTFALFVNSAILIVAGASLSNIPDADEASLFGIHTLLSSSIAPAAGTIFALALLLSGVSAGVVCTIAGQMVSEGALRWAVPPFLRRILTRSISITPAIIVAGAVGRDGLTAALNGTQVALSVALPFVSAPLIYFTSRNKFMTVYDGTAQLAALQDDEDEEGTEIGGANAIQLTTIRTSQNDTHISLGAHSATSSSLHEMANHWATTAIAVIIWIIITAMNIANLVLLGLGRGS